MEYVLQQSANQMQMTKKYLKGNTISFTVVPNNGLVRDGRNAFSMVVYIMQKYWYVAYAVFFKVVKLYNYVP